MSTAVKGVGEIIGGLAISVFCGILNGSWNAAFNPKVALAVGPKSTVETVGLGRQRTMLVSLRESISNLKAYREYDLDYHYAWMLFQFYSAAINAVVCICWAGGASNVSYVVTHVPTSSIMLLVVFSALWGVGMVLFGVACKIAGVGLGTSLRIAVVLVIGTFLPLAYYGKIKTAAGGVIMAGLAFVCAGLFFSAESLRIRDLDVLEAKKQQHVGDVIPSVEANGQDTGVPMDQPSQDKGREIREKEAPVEPEYSTCVKVSVCIIGGMLASLIQFNFIFGQDLVTVAKNNVVTPIGGSASIIWLFTLSIGCIPSIIYGFYTSPKEIPLKTIWRCPWWRHIILMGTSIVYIAPIHLYGLTVEALLPKAYAASIAWPIFMSVTVAQGLTLSICLGEWKLASTDALSKLRTGLFLSSIGVIVFMVSVAV